MVVPVCMVAPACMVVPADMVDMADTADMADMADMADAVVLADTADRVDMVVPADTADEDFAKSDNKLVYKGTDPDTLLRYYYCDAGYSTQIHNSAFNVIDWSSKDVPIG